MAAFHDEARALFPYLPPPLLDLLVNEWVESDDLGIAIQKMRESTIYETYFPGNRRDDGTLRYTEADYMAQIQGYTTTLTNFGVDPADFRSRFTELITGGVSAREFQGRVESLYSNVLSRGDSIRAWYAANGFASDISDAALLASAMDPTTDPLVFEQRYRQAQIGGAAADAGFNVGIAEVSRLANAGLDEQAARQFYNQAKGMLPTLSTLVARHNDPDDTFDLSELTDAVIFADPDQVRRMTNLYANEASMFSPVAQLFRRGDDGKLPGLTAR